MTWSAMRSVVAWRVASGCGIRAAVESATHRRRHQADERQLAHVGRKARRPGRDRRRDRERGDSGLDELA